MMLETILLVKRQNYPLGLEIIPIRTKKRTCCCNFLFISKLPSPIQCHLDWKIWTLNKNDNDLQYKHAISRQQLLKALMKRNC